MFVVLLVIPACVSERPPLVPETWIDYGEPTGKAQFTLSDAHHTIVDERTVSVQGQIAGCRYELHKMKVGTQSGRRVSLGKSWITWKPEEIALRSTYGTCSANVMNSHFRTNVSIPSYGEETFQKPEARPGYEIQKDYLSIDVIPLRCPEHVNCKAKPLTIIPVWYQTKMEDRLQPSFDLKKAVNHMVDKLTTRCIIHFQYFDSRLPANPVVRITGISIPIDNMVRKCIEAGYSKQEAGRIVSASDFVAEEQAKSYSGQMLLFRAALNGEYRLDIRSSGMHFSSIKITPSKSPTHEQTVLLSPLHDGAALKKGEAPEGGILVEESMGGGGKQ